MRLAQRLNYLQKQGCFPSLYLRGGIWRAHINASGNFWADALTPTEAMEKAVKFWQKKGKPMDGLAG